MNSFTVDIKKWREGLVQVTIYGPGASELTEDRIRAALSAPKAGAVERRQFPVLGTQGQRIDFQLVSDHGEQARKNHYQSVERLAERGGLSWEELFAVLHDRPFAKIDTNDAIIACRTLEKRYLSATSPVPALTDEAVWAGCKAVYPHLFKRGLKPLETDGENTRKQLAETEAMVRSILLAALPREVGE